MKLKFFFIVLALLWQTAALAYPWTFFRQAKPLRAFELSSRASYFMNGSTAAFSGLKLNRHRQDININLGYNYSFLERRHYFRVSELAVHFPLSKKWKMSLGFQDLFWSEADRYWNQGLWQPRYLLDPFRPAQMGLPGLYFNYEGDSSLTFLLSYFYLPDIIIYPRLKDGRIVSRNPFFVDSIKGFDWNIKKLELFNIRRFFRPMAAFQIKHSLNSSNISLSYAYKPINQFQYVASFKGMDPSSKKPNGFAINGFNFSILSHHLLSLEQETNINDRLSFFAGLSYESPEKRLYGKGRISDSFESHLIGSAALYLREDLGKGSSALFSLGWMHVMESDSEGRRGNKVTEDFEAEFGRGFLWREALSASVEYGNKNALKGFLFRARANYALDNGFYGLAGESHFHLSRRFLFYLSADALFRSSESAPAKNSSSIKKYKDLSRLLAGVKYVF